MNNDDSLRGNWSFPTQIRFGAGRVAELPKACKSLGMERPLLVTDRELAHTPIVREAMQDCIDAGLSCGLFAEVQGNPIAANVEAGIEVYRRNAHDGVIAFGGGSGLDAAKAIAFMSGQTRPMWDFEDREDWWQRADPDTIAPVVAVPTTAGTGSEVGRAAVIIHPEDHTKKIIFHPKMLPAIVIADPELTLSLPPRITAATGMDALSHNLEAYCSPLFHPLAQGIALEGMRLIKEWLPIAVREGGRFEARAHMLVASSMGATAFQKGLGAMHSLSHPCGSVLNTHHGLTNAVVMPYVLRFNRAAIEEKLQALARYLDLADTSFTGVLDWILALRQEIGIPHTLTELGVTEEHIPLLAKMAAVDPTASSNPVELTVENLTELYRNAIQGILD